MKNYFNYTDRQDNIRKTGSNPEIKVIVKEKDDITEYEPIINFDKERKLPLDARVFIQAYSSEGFVGKPEDFGTVSKPDIKIVKESDVGKDEIKFRLKVVSTKNKLKKILATCYKIVPWGTNTWLRIGSREQDCLIEYEIVPAEIPVLYFQKGYGLERDLEQSNYLKATPLPRRPLANWSISIRSIDSGRWRDCLVFGMATPATPITFLPTSIPRRTSFTSCRGALIRFSKNAACSTSIFARPSQ